MRPFGSITIILTFCSIFTYGNTTREYIASKQGVTIICGGSFDSVESQKRLNNFLDFLLSKISRSDNRTKIVIQACALGFDRLKGDKRKEFIFVGYDTLLKRDTIFFEKSELSYNQEIYNLLPTQTWMYNGWFPLFTIDSIYSTNDVGLKIKYLGYDPSIDFFDRLIEIVNYSLTNIDKIKTTQHYYPMPCFMNKGAFVSVLSFDTASLNRIELKYYGFDKSLLPKSSYRIWAWTLLFLIGGIFIYLLARRKKTTANIGIANSGAGRKYNQQQ